MDTWCGDCPLYEKFNRLFDLSLNKKISVYNVLTSNYNSLNFTRRLTWEGLENLEELKILCNNHCLLGIKKR